jgi:glycosyltransferase involved in cell wall biosynthesis
MVKGIQIPRVFTIHGFIHADTRLSGQRLALLRSWLWRWVETAGWAEQPHIISISPYVRERLRGIARGVVHDIDNPIATEFFEVDRRENGVRLFCAGIICRRKNQLVLVEALARLRACGIPAELRLAGPVGEAEYGNLLSERIEALDLTDAVHLLGTISSQQVREELSAASAFVLPSLEEGAPMGVEEAMGVGVPVVTSNRCGMPYMVRDGESGYLIDPMDLDDLVLRLADVLTNEALRARMSAVSRQIARYRFHPDIIARKTREVYYQALRQASLGNGHVRR